MIYELVFIVVLASVVVQGSTIRVAARRFAVRAETPEVLKGYPAES